MSTLRGPGGCPWDKEQDNHSLKPMVLEEAYEVVEAISENDMEGLCGELGDLLFQIVFFAQMAKEAGDFTIDDIIERVHDKMVRRHPHVFGDQSVSDSDEVLRNWEAIKLEERKSGPAAEREHSILDGASEKQPAVMEAFQISTKVARVGFDWSRAGDCLNKVREELDEIEAALSSENGTFTEVEEEVGDLFFSMVNVARLLKVDPETALKMANKKFRRRFRYIEEQVQAAGSQLDATPLEEMERLWQEAKTKSPHAGSAG